MYIENKEKREQSESNQVLLSSVEESENKNNEVSEKEKKIEKVVEMELSNKADVSVIRQRECVNMGMANAELEENTDVENNSEKNDTVSRSTSIAISSLSV